MVEEPIISDVKVTAIIPAAGRGMRLGFAEPKQFIKLNKKPVLIYCLEVLDTVEEINEIIISLQPSEVDRVKKLIKQFKIKKVVDLVNGGKERIDSVRNAFTRITSTDYVLVHDSVRPFITNRIVKDVLMAGISHGAAISAIPVTDTVKLADRDLIVKTLDRKGLWLAQTPQVFKYEVLARAYKEYEKHPVEITDESGLVELLGIKVKIVPGSIFNIKITKKEDMMLAQLIARMP
ncbi:MAG: 2-C-methyl-D-erythritol 4-phosphate cytidylyltransferase [bacterium]